MFLSSAERLTTECFWGPPFGSSLALAATSPDKSSLSSFSTASYTHISISPLESVFTVSKDGLWELHMLTSGVFISRTLSGTTEWTDSCRLSPMDFRGNLVIVIRPMGHTFSSEDHCMIRVSWESILMRVG